MTYADPTGHNALRLWMTEQALQGAGAGATVKPFPGSPPIPPTYVIDQPFMTPSEPTVYEQPFIGPPAPTVTQQPFIGPEYPVVNQQPLIEQEVSIYYSDGMGNVLPGNRKILHDELVNKGFTSKGTTDGGYVEYKHEGTTVWIRPDGEVLTIKKEWLPDGSKKVPVRYNWDGTPVQDSGHNTGEYVESIEEATYLPPKKSK
ncbi:hypothetical protein [Paenibacillus elgii]|uniref:hypothetical protein n=1 Tax=Paenibacillus elgii TaxID=189691 RepID=UPI0030DAADD1